MNKQYTPDDLMKAKKEAAKLLLHPNKNVVGVGIGKKRVNGTPAQEDCIRIYVVSKTYRNDLGEAAKWDPTVLGVPTEIIEVGRFGRKGRKLEPRRDTRLRPGAPIRIRIPDERNAPNVNQSFIGTLGAVVAGGPNKYLLSCNHILAANGLVPKDTDIFSAEFVGGEVKLAERSVFVELDGGVVDCALALLPKNAKQDKVQPTFPDDFVLGEDVPIDPKREMKVIKFGAATDFTKGTIIDDDADLYVDYSFGTFRFDHQVMIDSGKDGEEFALAGDSGSIVIHTATNQATAMIIAASGRFAVACSLPKVFSKLETELKIPKGTLKLAK